jgi:hypothetical protein
MSAKRILFLASLAILMLCVTQHFAIAARRQVANGQCGAANGVAVRVAPTTNLCASGTASAVAGSGPWSWRCNGSRGSSALCSAPVEAARGATTTAGVPLPPGWTLQQSDRFGTDGTVKDFAALHALYYEGPFFDRNADGTAKIPNVVIANEQQTFSHFEDAIAFTSDHLTIQGRGHPDGSITSAEMISHLTARSWAVEAKITVPSADKTWAAFWFYGADSSNTDSEIDTEFVVGAVNMGTHVVSMIIHPGSANEIITDPKYSGGNWMDPTFDFSSGPHTYTMIYDDTTGRVSRFIDGKLIFSAEAKWNGGPGGADMCMLMTLAVGGDWPGNLSNPSAYVGNLDFYLIEYYGPGRGRPARRR